MEKENLEKLLNELAAGHRSVPEVVADLQHWRPSSWKGPFWIIIADCGPETWRWSKGLEKAPSRSLKTWPPC